ncbi:YwqG family protein [Acinetobacter silvestris]|uniref:DUF1963 domain-containing protein n=1 Tax=Acinetobacter silvestris TaxID=1977882 RepID=A0A1Y3CCC1_9GAMM|nr:YwqG family protein [Acinetobacter silvestris]OTG64697.1 hypothetical protein B9T28_10860 [Acinetobacter silvestris]
MNVNWNDIPEAIQPYKDKILITAQSSFEMSLVSDEHLALWQSKVGGEPYLPLKHQYPVDSNNVPLKLLAQINFAELPLHPDLPTKGILQFFIGGDDLYGADFEKGQKQEGFRVLFFDDVMQEKTQLQQDFAPHLSRFTDEEYCSPLSGQYRIEFKPVVQYISVDDFAFGQKILAVEQLYDFEEKFEGEDFYDEWLEPYCEKFSANGHRLLGYPYFTQSDPREYEKNIQDYVLLLQIDSDANEGNDIMWGDVGVGNFFIHPDDLKKRDFSRVLYNWDCS